jgi:hypothetical protein
MLRTSLSALIFLAALLAWQGCGAQPRAYPVPSTALRIEPLESRVDVIHGHTLVVPVEISGAAVPDVLSVRLDDRRAVPAMVRWIGVSADVHDVPAWLPPPGRWSATPPSALPAATTGESREEGWWVLVLDLPHDAINQSISIGGTRIPLNWYLDPAQLDVAAAALQPPHPRWAGSRQVLDRARPEMLSPLRRWRYRLLADGLSPQAPSPEIARFDDPALEAMARQAESRWAMAIGMLWLTDRALAERLKRRLALVIEFPDDVAVPAWPVDDGGLESLLPDLLNPALRPDERSARAAAWLDELSPAAVWIVDDAGLEDALSGETVLTAAVANLLDRGVVASASISGGGRSPDMRELPAMAVRTLTPAAPAPTGVATPEPRQISFNIGRWSGVRTAIPDSLRINPPGLRLEPLTGDWTLPALLSGAPLSSMRIAAAWSTTALLHYRAPEESAGDDPAGTWVLHLECRGEPVGSEEVVLWLGPFGAPRGILRITPDGVSDALTRGNARQSFAGATFSRRPDRWVAQVPIPASMIDSTSELRIALVRTDGRGVRSTWPRPMLPWQEEPGRLSIDTATWGDVSRPGAMPR